MTSPYDPAREGAQMNLAGRMSYADYLHLDQILTAQEPLSAAHDELQNRRKEFGITAIDEIKDISDGQFFLLSDLNRNWWEVAYLQD